MDRTNHVVPYEVVSLAMRAPHGFDLWFDLKFDGMDGAVISVHPTNLGRQEIVHNGLERHVKFAFTAEDREKNIYEVEVHETSMLLRSPEGFEPHMFVERTDAPGPVPRRAAPWAAPVNGPDEPRHAVRSCRVAADTSSMPGARGGV